MKGRIIAASSITINVNQRYEKENQWPEKKKERKMVRVCYEAQ
jgi:hypothetical protein